MKRIQNFFDCSASWILPLIFGGFLLLLIASFKSNFLALGGEGNFYLNYSLVRKFYWFSWNELGSGTGFPNPLLHYAGINFLLFGFLEQLRFAPTNINTVAIFLNYFLPFISIYYLFFKVLKLNRFIALVLSIFYIVNPLSTVHLSSLMFWNTAPMYILPLTFSIIYSHYRNHFKLFMYFGIFTSFFSYSFANIPYLGIFHIFLAMSLIMVGLLKENRLNLVKNAKLLLILELSFISFNAWWLFNLIRIQLQDISLFYTKEFAIAWASSSGNNNLIVNKLLTLRTLVGNSTNDFLSFYYNTIVANVILFIPFFIILLSQLFSKVDIRKGSISALIFLLLTLFLNKGINNPFSEGYIFLLKYAPFFSIFKSPLEKFSVLYIFLISLVLALILNRYKSKFIYLLMALYIIFCTVPYTTLNFIPVNKISHNQYVSRKFELKNEYKNVIDAINNEVGDYRVLSLPGSLNYQVTMRNHENQYYRGMDPILYSLNKPYIAAYSGSNVKILYQNLKSKDLCNLLSLYNVNKILINRDIIPSFGFEEKQTVKEIERILSYKMRKKMSEGSMVLFDNCTTLSHFYIPKPENVIVASRQKTNLLRIISKRGYKTESTIIYSEDNANKIDKLNITKRLESNDTTTIKFKKINSAKYLISVSNIKDSFHLTFLETFHNVWRASIVSRSRKVGIPDKHHYMANGYANDWLIDVNRYCTMDLMCVKKSNGTYSLEIEVEFLPEQIIYWGWLLTGSTILVCFSISILQRSRRKH